MILEKMQESRLCIIAVLLGYSQLPHINNTINDRLDFIQLTPNQGYHFGFFSIFFNFIKKTQKCICRPL